MVEGKRNTDPGGLNQTGLFSSFVVHMLLFLAGILWTWQRFPLDVGAEGGDPLGTDGLFIINGSVGGTQGEFGGHWNGSPDVSVRPTDVSRRTPRVVQDDSTPVYSKVQNPVTDYERAEESLKNSDHNSVGLVSSDPMPLLGPGSRGGSSGIALSNGRSAIARGAGDGKSLLFMGVEGRGQTVAFVVDVSSSMEGKRLRFAKNQLKASLSMLSPNQSFTLIFYNETPNRVRLRRLPERSFYFATSINCQLAGEEIDRITCSNGTAHEAALLNALDLRPDVIYFLTDGEPELFASALSRIEKVSGDTVIHAVRIYSGAVTSRADNWMARLAAMCGGRYQEVTPATPGS